MRNKKEKQVEGERKQRKQRKAQHSEKCKRGGIFFCFERKFEKTKEEEITKYINGK